MSICRTTSSEKVTELATAGFCCTFTLHMLCVFFFQQRRHDTRKKRHLRNNEQSTPPDSSQWEESAGQESLEVECGGGGGLWWSTRPSAPLIGGKRLQRETTMMFHKHAAVLQLHLVHFLLLKKEGKKIKTGNRRSRKKHEIKKCWKIWHLRMCWIWFAGTCV